MRHGRNALILASALLTAGAPPSAPDKVVQEFYTLTQKYVNTGALPATPDQTTLEQLLTPTLFKSVEAAQRADRLYAKRTHFKKQPLIDGDLFSSLYDGPTEVSPGACRANTTTVLRCPVDQSAPDPDGKTTLRWTDTLVMAKTVNGWRVDDIEFGGAGEGSRKGKLSDLLNHVVKRAYHDNE